MNQSRSASELALVVCDRLLERLEAHPDWQSFLVAWPRAGDDTRRLRAAVNAAFQAQPSAREAALIEVSRAFDGLACALGRFRPTSAGTTGLALDLAA